MQFWIVNVDNSFRRVYGVSDTWADIPGCNVIELRFVIRIGDIFGYLQDVWYAQPLNELLNAF